MHPLTYWQRAGQFRAKILPVRICKGCDNQFVGKERICPKCEAELVEMTKEKAPSRKTEGLPLKLS